MFVIVAHLYALYCKVWLYNFYFLYDLLFDAQYLLFIFKHFNVNVSLVNW